MAKKRKAPSSRSQDSKRETELDARDARKTINTFEDVADSDDEFRMNQDEILLGEGPQAKRQRKWAEEEEFLEPSDEEVLGYSDEEQSDVEAAPPKKSKKRRQSESDASDNGRGIAEDEEEGLGWGTSKADLYGADEIETEEQALEEEAEAIRLQKKQLESMNAADYGFDEAEWQQGDGTKGDDQEDENDGVVTEVLPQLQIDPNMTPTERLQLLRTRYPEFDLLSKDLLDLEATHTQLTEAAQSSTVTRVKLRAASAYMGALIMYFCLFTSTASSKKGSAVAMSATSLRDHPVMESLVKCREVWSSVSQLPDDGDDSGSDSEGAQYEEGSASDVGWDQYNPSPVAKSRAERHTEAAQAASEKRKAERMKRTEANLADLDDLIAPSIDGKVSKSKKSAPRLDSDDSDLGEEAPLTEKEAAEKAKRKKSLRFYTSQIAQKANKRGAAGRNAGGDDDIPHRERLRDRQTRLNAEAEKRGKKGAEIGSDLGGDSDEEDKQQAQQIRAHADDDEYYDMVAARTSKKKSDKAELAEAQRQAAMQGGQVVREEVVGTDGKRKINYMIEKNKGLTPHRKKDVRNPRVKKKKKYEEKKKKLASMKPVYKGGEGRGGYGGELTGIKKGLVKSTRL
ncbi:unnamed protein product [Zymoseptoria tritici ST99CH_1A5]|uniref:Sas10 C-terminal domain-containing protein n=1 Tax=Zymoseptoria tritici ST99CH_1A5 TaxID=1276529 RepID=A0A1Y6L8M6_ZYMTR|nr:unnamed protein product [Zymoseptoria tritici ST99CH_1A5]